MPVKPQPVRIQCRQCGWTTVYAPRSDALVEAPPGACKKCHSVDLERTHTSVLESVLSSVLSLVKKK